MYDAFVHNQLVKFSITNLDRFSKFLYDLHHKKKINFETLEWDLLIRGFFITGKNKAVICW